MFSKFDYRLLNKVCLSYSLEMTILHIHSLKYYSHMNVYDTEGD